MARKVCLLVGTKKPEVAGHTGGLPRPCGILGGFIPL